MDEKALTILSDFAEELAHTAEEILGLTRVREVLGDTTAQAVFLGVEKRGLLGRKIVRSPLSEERFNKPEFLKNISALLTTLSTNFGFTLTESRLEYIYGELQKKYSVDTVGHTLMPFIPEGFLEKHRIEYLTKGELEERVIEKTSELRVLNEQLESKVAARTVELQGLLTEQREHVRLLGIRDQELTEANEQLRELSARKSEFLATAAHQLRTPLSGFKWSLNMVLKGELGTLSTEQTNLIRQMYESNERMIQLVQDMLNANVMDSGTYRLNLVPVQIADIVTSVVSDLTPTATKNNLKISCDFGTTQLPIATVDKEKIHSVFQNLIDNSIKYGRAGGTISVTARAEGTQLAFSVADTGIGIPLDQQASIFSRFFRARNAVVAQADGSGLGLFIAKRIIEEHGGAIRFETEEGRGTTFYFTIQI